MIQVTPGSRRFLSYTFPTSYDTSPSFGKIWGIVAGACAAVAVIVLVILGFSKICRFIGDCIFVSYEGIRNALSSIFSCLRYVFTLSCLKRATGADGSQSSSTEPGNEPTRPQGSTEMV